MTKLITFLREQNDLELEHIKALEPTMRTVTDKLVYALLESIVHDSLKHSAFCDALLQRETGSAPTTIGVEDVLDLANTIEEHVKVEKTMIKRLESILGHVAKSRVRGILKHMLSDERRHHALLKRLANLLSRSEYDGTLNLFQD